jgi:hypothetical protein
MKLCIKFAKLPHHELSDNKLALAPQKKMLCFHFLQIKVIGLTTCAKYFAIALLFADMCILLHTFICRK